MSEPTPTGPMDPHASLRASDHDRDRVAETLAAAFAEGRLDPEEYAERLDGVYRARTFGDLAAYTTDLPGHLPARSLAGEVDRSPDPTPVVAGGRVEPAVVAIFSSSERSGAWTVPHRLVTTAVFGEVTLDLMDASLAADEVELVVNAIFGSVRIRVPDDLRVVDGGAAVLGTRQLKGGTVGGTGPLVRLTGAAVFGSVEVVRGGPWRRPLPGQRQPPTLP